jgi:hypothetical protein
MIGFLKRKIQRGNVSGQLPPFYREQQLVRIGYRSKAQLLFAVALSVGLAICCVVALMSGAIETTTASVLVALIISVLPFMLYTVWLRLFDLIQLGRTSWDHVSPCANRLEGKYSVRRLRHMKEMAISHKSGVNVGSTLTLAIWSAVIALMLTKEAVPLSYVPFVLLLGALLMPLILLLNGEHEAADTVVVLAVDTCLDRLAEQQEMQHKKHVRVLSRTRRDKSMRTRQVQAVNGRDTK